MTNSNSDKVRTYWSSELAFSLGVVAAAVGLGSIWRFPYLAGTGGGSAFIFVFVLAILLIATPLLTAEFIIGRRSGRSPPQAAGDLAVESGCSRKWNMIGVLGTVAAFLVLSYYSVIAGWVLAYTWKCASGALVGLQRAAVTQLFGAFVSSPWQVGAWHFAFLALVTVISACGLHRGIEVANRIRAQALLLILVILVTYALATGDVHRGLRFAFAPNFMAITPRVALSAIGQAFFATGVGMGMMIAYGAYCARGTSLVRSSLIISGSILVASLLATLMIFPLVFRYGLDPSQGPPLVFEVLATAFAEMPTGRITGTMFFLLLVFAALTPSIAALEPVVAWVQERSGLHRAAAACVAGATAWILGIGSVLSFNVWADWRPLRAVPALAHLGLFDVVDHFSTNILLPVGALATSIFVGWRLKSAPVQNELGETSLLARRVCIRLLRYLCPPAIAAVLIISLLT
jgi:NSS family neurotransmitter:Na+ symporter